MMFVGVLEKKNVSFYQAGTNLPLAPSLVENGAFVWKWDAVYAAPFDVRIALEQSSYVGAVSLCVERGTATRVEVLIQEEICGAYAAETGKSFRGDVTIPVGMEGSELILRVYPNLENIGIADVELLGARVEDTPFVWPTPKSICFGKQCLQIGDICAKTEDEDEVFVAAFLKESLRERFGESFFVMGGERVVIEKTPYLGERYTVSVKEGEILLSGAKRLSMLYAADTFTQTASAMGVLEYFCDDQPEKALRGFHCGLPSLENFEFMRRFFRYVLLPLRYNTVFIQISGGMEYKKHPEINEGYLDACAKAAAGELPPFPHVGMIADGTVLSQEQVKTYVSYARNLGMEIIPEVQSLGHVQYITYAHPELAEISKEEVAVQDTRLADLPPAAVYPHCYCPSLEESYRIIFDIIDEVVEVFAPERYVHIGQDEIYQIGVCERCRQRSPSDILLEHVTRLYRYLKERHGLNTVMWADMLHSAPTTAYRTADRRADFPKDILMLDFIWYFDFDKDIEDELLPYGYQVAIGNLYSSHFKRYRSRIGKKNVIGGQTSTWRKLEEVTLAENGKIWECLYLSEMLWNASAYDERNRRSYSYLLTSRIQPRMRDHLRAAFRAKGYEETEIPLPENRGVVPRDVSFFCPEAFRFGAEEIAVGKAFDRLVFEHATVMKGARVLRHPIAPMGEYLLTYEDGATLSVPVKYASNVLCYNDTYGEPLPHKYYRHNGYIGTWLVDPVPCGKSSCGEDVGFFAYTWENPRSEVRIQSISYKSAHEGADGPLVKRIVGLKARK